MAQMSSDIRNTIIIPSSCREQYLPQRGPCTHHLNDAGVLHAGVSRLTHGYEVIRPRPTRHMIIVTAGGSGRITVGDETYDLKPDSVVVCPAGTPHRFAPVEETWRIAWFYLADAPHWAVVRGACESPRPVTDAASITGLCEGFVREQTRLADGIDERGAVEVCGAYAELIVAHLSRYAALACERPDAKGERLRTLWLDVRSHPDLPWSVGDLANRVGTSPAQLTRDVKNFFGRTPWQEVIRIRMEIAHDLLTNTDYPLKLIATRVGYADAFVFSTAFKSHFGEPPSRVRAVAARKSHS